MGWPSPAVTSYAAQGHVSELTTKESSTVKRPQSKGLGLEEEVTSLLKCGFPALGRGAVEIADISLAPATGKSRVCTQLSSIPLLADAFHADR